MASDVSSEWAIVSAMSIGVGTQGAAYNFIGFDLVNLTVTAPRQTVGPPPPLLLSLPPEQRQQEFSDHGPLGSARRIAFRGLGHSPSPLPISGSVSKISYSKFTTSRPVRFTDFDHAPAFVASYGAVAFGGVKLVIFEKSDIHRILAEVYNDGWGFYVPDADLLGGAISVVPTPVRPLGLVPWFRLDISSDDAPAPRSVHFEAKEAQRMFVIDNALFHFDSDTVNRTMRKLIVPAIRGILDRGRRHVVIEGHTDAVGPASYNQDLSYRRALAVRAFLVENGIPGARAFAVTAFGESRPVASNSSNEGRRKNRRVVIRIN